MKFFPPFWIVCCFLACQQQPAATPFSRSNGYAEVLKTKDDSLFHEIMQGHDGAMAKMGRLSLAISEVNAAKDSLIRNKQQASAFEKLAIDLEQAEVGMDNWMKAFKMDTLKDAPDKRIKYFEEEKRKIMIVKVKIIESLSKADSLMRKR